MLGEVRAEARRQNIIVDGDGWQEAIDLDLILGLIKAGDEEKAKNIVFDNLKARQGLKG